MHIFVNFYQLSANNLLPAVMTLQIQRDRYHHRAMALYDR